ncbi:FAD-dependent monooxygenase, partial [Cumulibacter manganitolerans]|uniref:FAD-dependent monooxygenase n=1 Tax=Cumulibacter manganitolerans TaxID=1884992 RepID=UPI00129635E6
MYFQPQQHDFTPVPDRDGAWPVIVAGAGPIGLTAALGLAKRGVEVLVLEAGDSVSYGSRAICVSRNSLQILDRLGAGQRFVDAALPWTGGRSYYRDQQVLQFEMPAAAEYARPPMVNMSQSVAEQILVEQVQREPLVTLRWQCAVRRAAQDVDGVDVGIDTPAGPGTVRARWLVGADGARSAVRAALGVGLSGTSYEGRYVIADIHWPSAWPTERRVWFDPPSNPGATIIMHRQPDDIWRVDYQLRPEDDPEAEVAEDRVRERIERHLRWLGNELPWTLEWVSLYRAHALSADSYRHGRVLLAGDAAHLVPIFGVRGLNSGLEDADDLAWKLSLVEAGASDRLLDSYSAERRDAWAQNIASARKSTLFMTPGTPGYRMTRDAALLLAAHDPVFSHLLNPRQSSATHARRSPITSPDQRGSGERVRPGDMVDDRRLAAGELDGVRAATLHEAIGAGFAVLGVGVPAEVLDDACRRARQAVGAALPVAGLRVAAGTGLADAL